MRRLKVVNYALSEVLLSHDEKYESDRRPGNMELVTLGGPDNAHRCIFLGG